MNCMAYGPQSNYTDWATAAGRRILVLNLADRVSAAVPNDHQSRFSRPEPLLFLSNSSTFIRGSPQQINSRKVREGILCSETGHIWYEYGHELDLTRLSGHISPDTEQILTGPGAEASPWTDYPIPSPFTALSCTAEDRSSSILRDAKLQDNAVGYL
jgi:hypothetical protein